MNNINTLNFSKDLERGEDFEKKVLLKIQLKYPKAYKVEGNFKYYDIEIPEKNYGVELKYDEKSDETGNYFIEYEFNGHPSGIATTKAHWYVIGNYMWWCWVDVEELKNLLRPKINAYTRELTGEDGTRVKGVVIPMRMVWDLPSTQKLRHPSYEQMWEDMGRPSNFTIEDMKWIDENL